MAESFHLLSDDVAPADDLVVGEDCKPLNAVAVEQVPDKAACAFNRRTFDKTDVSALARDDVESAIEAFDVALVRGHDVNRAIIHFASANTLTVDPATTPIYCRPSTAYVIGLAFQVSLVSKRHSCLPVFASAATTAPPVLSP